MKKSIYLFVATCLTLLGITTSCGKKDPYTHITLAEVTHSLFYAPQYVALEKGFYLEEGLKVDVITTPGADKTMAALLSKDAQIGLMGPEASIYVYQGGEKNHAINFAQLTHKDGSFLLAREKMPNFSWNDLKGKTIIGGRKGGMPEMTLEYVLKKAGLDVGQNDPTKEVNIRTDVSFDVMAGVFTAGQSDFVTLFEPSASQVERNGIGHIVASIGESSGEVPYTCYSALKNYVNQNEDVLKAFTRATLKGIHYVLNEEKAKVVETLKPQFLSSDEEEIGRVLDNYLSIGVWNEDYHLYEESYHRLEEILTLAGELDSPVPYEKIVHTLDI